MENSLLYRIRLIQGTHRPSLTTKVVRSRNKVVLGELDAREGCEGLYLLLMLYRFVYMDLVGFVFFICVFISSWVFLMLF